MNLLKVLCQHYASLQRSAHLVQEVSQKNCMVDMFLSRAFLHVNYSDYLNLGFYNKPWKLRKKYIVDDLTPALKYNSGNSKFNHLDKRTLLYKIIPYIHRKILFTEEMSFEQFENLIVSSKFIFYKPVSGCGGKGVKKIDVSMVDSISCFYNDIKSWPKGLLEETITQHGEMDKMCSTLVQTIRFCVFKHKQGPRIMFATLKTTRNSNSFVDNASAGGIFANIDMVTGCVRTNAFCELSSQPTLKNLDVKLFSDEGLSVHPISGTKFKGFLIPYFQEAKALVLEVAASEDFYNHRLLGFDIAITNWGPEIIEVNADYPGIVDLWQIACKPEPLRAVMSEILEE